MRYSKAVSALITAGAFLGSTSALAAPALRTQVTQHGDFVLIGNSGGYECAAGTPAPVVGTVTCPALLTADSSPDVFWRAGDMTGAVANSTVTALTSRTTARLTLPAGATVTYARVYWAGFLPATTPADNKLNLEVAGAAVQEVTADASVTVDRALFHWYQSSADVTTLIKASGTVRVSGIGSVDLPLTDNNDPINAWSLVVFYRLDSDPPRNLALFDGLDLVLPNSSATVMISGFLVPNAGFDAKLGVIAYEGENQLVGDSMSFNGVLLSNASNPVDNFFNSSRSFLGAGVSVVGDLPQLTGGPASMSGVDLDVVDVKAQLKANDSSATISASSTGDTYLLGGFVTSISTFQPDFSSSNKVFTDVNGGSILPGDELEYVITAINKGNDASTNTVVTDALPLGITYKPGSLRISAGANAGNKTDAKGDDQGEYDAMTRTLTVRIGTNAGAVQGGTIAIDGTSEIRFRVTVDANATGTINNQAIVTGGGAQGSPPAQYPTDGNGTGPGAPPTAVVIDQCQSNTDCMAPTAVCNTTASPKVCVGCVTDADCSGDPKAAQCNTAMHVCGCFQNCGDADGDGIPDGVEVTIGTDPNDADSDDDGVPDGAEPSASVDSDGDGLINALDPDSDNDGLFDGTELGLDCSSMATNAALGHCKADADKGQTKTNPLERDTDGGGATDGAEDFNLDGAIDAGETDPTAGHGADDTAVIDTDGDGLSDGTENFLGSNPKDADSDDDGVRDGAEPNPSDDTDGDGLRNVLDVDSDNDGLFDGTETGKACDDPATNVDLGHCKADGDLGVTMTSPLDPDTDKGGVKDGAEDFNHDGVLDPGETDPTLGHGADDTTLVDSDGDGLNDDAEVVLGTDPNDADSDDDGVPDGAEPNPSDDSDGDGKINALDPDSDDDGLFDGTELGLGCDNPATSPSSMTCIADADNGTTRTSPLDPDTDHGGVKDGDEDKNHNGVVDNDETDPNDPADDSPMNGEAGAGAGGSAGEAGAPGSGGTSGSAGSVGNGGMFNGGVLEGGGCSCRTAPGHSGAAGGLVLGLAGLGLLVSRRRKR